MEDMIINTNDGGEVDEAVTAKKEADTVNEVENTPCVEKTENECAEERQDEDTVCKEDIEADLEAQITELEMLYPDVSASEIIEDAEVARLMRSGVTLTEAYRLAHFDDLLATCAMRAAEEAEHRLIEHIRASGLRPAENGTAAAQGRGMRRSVAKLSRTERAKIAARAGRGEYIEF